MSEGYFVDFKWKVEDFIVKLLQQDAYLITKVAGRVFAQHLLTIQNPVFPLITVTKSGPGGDSQIENIDYSFLLIDVWSKRNKAECCKIYVNRVPVLNTRQGIYALLHKKGFDTPEAIIQDLREVWYNDNLYEPADQTFRLSARYAMDSTAKECNVA